MKGHARWLIWLVAVLLITSCAVVTPQPMTPEGQPPEKATAEVGANVPQPAEQTVPTVPQGGMHVKPKTLQQGDQWPTRGPEGFYLITGPKSWVDFLTNQHSDPERWPEVDWEHEVVFVALMGGKRTGGYRITVKEVIVQEDLVFVRVQEESPGRGEMVIQVLTSPYHVVTIPREVLPKDGFTLRVLSSKGVWEAKVTDVQGDMIYAAQQTMTLPERPGKGEAPTK